MNNFFPAIVIGIFVVLAFGAVTILATFSSGGGEDIGKVEIWGSFSKDIVNNLLDEVGRARGDFDNVTYKSFPQDELVPQMVEAIASGTGPDLVIFPASELIEHGDKLTAISFASVSRRDFQDTFIEAGEVLIGDDGLAGLPFVVDPLVLYWNRTLFSASGIARPPKYWDEVSDDAVKLTKADKNGTILQSAVALGEWGNVLYAKEIVLSLLHQLGNPVISIGQEGGLSTVFAARGAANVAPPGDSVIRFYTQFADPVKPMYSWNRSQKESRDAFTSGTLGMFAGLASDLIPIRNGNPNLNFDVAMLPTARGGGSGIASHMYVLSIPRGSENPTGALLVAAALSGIDAQKSLGVLAKLPSVRRDLLVASPEDQYQVIFRDSALNAFSFRDPNSSETDAIFKRLVEGVSSGKLRVSDAVLSADGELRALLRQK